MEKPQQSSGDFSASKNYTAMILSKPDTTENYVKYEAVIEKINVIDAWLPVDKKAILYFRKDTASSLHYGDRVLIKGTLQFIENNLNPHAFDFGLYLQRKGIFLQDFINDDAFAVINPDHNTSVRFWGMAAGDYMEKILSKYINSPRELNIVKAMLIGRRNEVTPEMEYVYQSTGTTHILAVSGLHVGIVYLLVSAVFKFLKRKKPYWAFYTIVLFSIWSFAFITGFSPSVQRAALMFSFILFGKFLRRKSNIYNTILASAFFILLFSPNLIYSVSFQLSYVAVLGIVYLYPKIYPLVYIKNRFIDFFWQITVLSVSVQLAAFPVTIYYFHQFPVLFAFTNLFAIPTATAVIVGSLGILLTSFMGIVPTILGVVLEYWIYFYNEAMLKVSMLPFAEIQNLHLKGFMVFLLICQVFLLTRFLYTKKLQYFRYFTIVLICISLSSLADRYKNSRQRQITFYQLNNRFYFDVFMGKSCFTNIDSDADIKQVYYNVTPNRTYHLIERVSGIRDFDKAKMLGKNTLFNIQNQSVLVLKDLSSILKQDAPVQIDNIIVGKELIDRLPEIAEYFHVKNIVLDNSIRYQDQIKLLTELYPAATIHSLHKDGAYIIRL